MRVKIIEKGKRYELENEVNEFIKGKDIIDIKYCGETNHPSYSTGYYSVMVIYK